MNKFEIRYVLYDDKDGTVYRLCFAAFPATVNQSPRNVTQHPPAPVQQTNPWASPSSDTQRVPSSEPWPATSTNPFAGAPAVNGVPSTAGNTQFPPQPVSRSLHHPHLQHTRSHSIDTGELSHWPATQRQQQQKPTLLEMAGQRSFQHNGSPWTSSSSAGTTSVSKQGGVDPFDVAWASKSSDQQSTSNPFGSKGVKSFEVKL